ncbi:unnamed protein product [Camellia sinensis]
MVATVVTADGVQGVDYSLRETRVQFSYGICGSGVKVCVEVRRAAKARLPPAGEAELLSC